MWQRRDRSARVPKQYAMPAAGLGALMGFAVAATPGVEHSAKAVLAAAVTGLPALVVDGWWKQRSRRRAEELFVMPTAQLHYPPAASSTPQVMRSGPKRS
jgi:hypothetical protein